MKRGPNKISEKLDSLQAPFDKDRLWTNLHTHKDFPQAPAKKRRGYWWLLLLGLVVGGGLAAYFSTASNVSSIQTDTPENAIIPIAIKEQKKEQQTTAEPSRNSANSTLALENSAAISATKEDSSNTTISTSSRASTSVTPQTFRVPENLKTTPPLNSTIKENQTPFSVPTNKSLIPTTALETTSTTVAETIEKTASTIQQSTIAATPVTPSEALRIDFAAVNSIPLLDLLPFPEDSLSDHLNLPPIIIPFDPATRLWTLSIGGGSGYVFHSITDSMSSRELGTGTTQTLESYLIELGLSRKLRHRLELSLGLQYLVNYRRYDAVFFEDVRTPVNENKRIVNKNTASYYHRYQHVDLKIGVGRTLPMRHFNLSYIVGVGANLNFQLDGKILDLKNSDIQLTDTRSYRKTLQPYLFGEALLSRSLTPNLDFYTGLELKSRFRLNTTNAAFSHTAFPIYGKLGLAFKF